LTKMASYVWAWHQLRPRVIVGRLWYGVAWRVSGRSGDRAEYAYSDRWRSGGTENSRRGGLVRIFILLDMTSLLVMERDSVGRRRDGLVFNFHQTGVSKGSTQYDCSLASKHQHTESTPSDCPTTTQETQITLGLATRECCSSLAIVVSVTFRRTCTEKNGLRDNEKHKDRKEPDYRPVLS
jgi:hypothetical protein